MDERKEFERWFEGHCLPCESNWFERDADGDYTFNATGHAWDGWQARAEQSRAECEALRLELDLCGQLKRGYQEQAALAAEECEALRAKAARYDWLRSHPEAVCVTVPIHGDWIPAISEQLDAAVDAAMGKEKA